jgi:hypothetical protein
MGHEFRAGHGQDEATLMPATLLLYCYCRGRRSSRQVEEATFDDVGARVICAFPFPRA